MTKYLFSIIYHRETGKPKKAPKPFLGKTQTSQQFQEWVTAETWQQALDYWRREMEDQGVEIERIERHVPVLASLPGDAR